MKVFLDANVLFSAAKAGTALAGLVELLAVNGFAVTSALAVLEARRNLTGKRPGWVAEFDRMLVRANLVPGATESLEVELVSKDRPILEAAVHARCTRLVTSDRRRFGLLCGRVVEGLKVVSLVGLAEDLVRSGKLYELKPQRGLRLGATTPVPALPRSGRRG